MVSIIRYHDAIWRRKTSYSL